MRNNRSYGGGSRGGGGGLGEEYIQLENSKDWDDRRSYSVTAVTHAGIAEDKVLFRCRAKVRLHSTTPTGGNDASSGRFWAVAP